MGLLLNPAQLPDLFLVMENLQSFFFQAVRDIGPTAPQGDAHADGR